MVGLCFLVPTVNAQIFNSTAKLVMPARTLTNESNKDIKTNPKIAEPKEENVSKQFKTLHTFLCCSLIKLLCFISARR